MMEERGFTQVLLHRPDSSELEQELEVDALNETIGATGEDGGPGGEGTVQGGEDGPGGEGGEGVIEGGAGGDGGDGGDRAEMVIQEVMEVMANVEVEEEEVVKEALAGEGAVVGGVLEAAVKAKLDNQDLEEKTDQAWAQQVFFRIALATSIDLTSPYLFSLL
ncbi:MAG: hypothetical protein J3R72DRAFT_434323, partial [Linnemannia gamsii]